MCISSLVVVVSFVSSLVDSSGLPSLSSFFSSSFFFDGSSDFVSSFVSFVAAAVYVKTSRNTGQEKKNNG